MLALLHSTAFADIQVVKQQRKSTTRISDTVKEYAFQVTARNNGAAATGVTAVVTSYSNEITVVSGNLDFPDMLPGETAKSTNLFVVRAPRGVRLKGAPLRIDFSATSTPVADAGADQVRAIGQLALLNGSGSYDPFGNPLTYAWTLQSAPPGSSAALAGEDSVLASFTPDLDGDYVFGLTVSNGTTSSLPATATLSTTGVAPVANAGADQIVRKRAIVELDGSGSTHLMEQPLTYAWQILSAPKNSKAVLSDPTALRPTFLADRRGSYRVQLIVSDGSRSSAPAVVTVTRGTRRTNTPPLADAGPDITSYGPTLPVVLQAGRSTDVEGDFLTYRWFVLGRPDGSTAIPTANDPNPIFRLDGAGAWHLQVNVSDGRSESIATMLVNTEADVAPLTGSYVHPGNSNPAVFIVDGEFRSIYPNSGATPGTLTRSWSLLSRPSGSAAGLEATASGDGCVEGFGFPACAALPTDVDGDYSVQMKATDEGSIVAVQAIGITRGAAARPVAVVDPSPQAPLRSSRLHFIDFAPGLSVTVDGSHSFDQNGLPLTYRWTLLHRPAGSNATLSDPQAPSPTIEVDVDGSYVAQLIVNNGVRDSLPVTTTLVNYVNTPPSALDLYTEGPEMSPCIPVTPQGLDPESVPSSSIPLLTLRPIDSTINGILINFVPEQPNGEAVWCYRPRRFFVGADQFTYEAVDSGFPTNCGEAAPDCYPPTVSSPASAVIVVNAVD